MKNLWKSIGCIIIICICGLLACNDTPSQQGEAVPTPIATAVPQTVPPTEAPQEEFIDVIELTPEPTPEPTPTPTPTPVPTPVYITIGAVGDIMVPSAIVDDVKTSEGLYDFSTLFLPMRELFGSVDLMCANLESPLAGEKGGYSGKKDERVGLISFNAPDSILDTLKAYGVDMLTTANNHIFDRGIEGLRRTVETIRNAGFLHTGTYLSEEERLTPCIVDVNGVKIGVVAATRLMNQAFIDINRSDAYRAFGYYMCSGAQLSDACRESIVRTKEAGAEFVILFAHWDYENDNSTSSDTRSLARQALAAGADCIIGSHPHRIKGAEYLTVEREDGPYTGLVLYSLGNFTANQQFTCMVGLFAQITLKKDFESGTVTLEDAGVLPTVTFKRSSEKPRFAVFPAYADPSVITWAEPPLDESEFDVFERARELAFKRLGKVEGLRILEDPVKPEEPTAEPEE